MDGATGPQGPIGLTGAQGPVGLQGGIGLIVAGLNTTVTGDGTIATPYQINTGKSDINQSTSTGVITHTNEAGDIKTANVISTNVGNLLTIGTDGGAILNTSALPAITADNGLTKTLNNIQLGGALIKPTIITADATNTLAIEGLQAGDATDNIVVADASGLLKTVTNASVSIEPFNVGSTTTKATGNTQNIYQNGNLGLGDFSAANPIARLDVRGAVRGGTPHADELSGTSAIGATSVAFGNGNKASGLSSAAIGSSNTSSGGFAIGMGSSNSATGTNSIALGLINTASGSFSTAIGSFNTVSQENGVALGGVLNTGSKAEVATGYGNAQIAGSATAFNATDVAFSVGNGQSLFIRSNAMVMLKNGYTGFGLAGTTKPTERIDIGTDNGAGRAAGLGSIRIRAINTAAYAGDNTMKVVVADANGVLKSVTQASIAPATTNTLTATNGSLVSTVNGVATTPAVNVLINADNGLIPTNGKVQLGGLLTGATTITADATKTLAIAGLQTGNTTDNVVVSDVNGVLKTLPQSSLVPTTTNTLTATNGSLVSTVNGVATTPAIPVLISANNGLTATNGNVVLGGALTAASTVTTDATNTLAIAGLQAGDATDNIVVADASGLLKTVTNASVSIEPFNVGSTTTKATGNTQNIYQNGNLGLGDFSATIPLARLDVRGALRGGAPHADEVTGTTTIGINSIALGTRNKASGNSTVAMGVTNISSGSASVAMGWTNSSTGIYTIAMGANNTAAPSGSMAMGQYLTPGSANEVVVGYGNAAILGSTSIAVASDVAFAVGNGTNIITRGNAMTLLKNGNVGFGLSGINKPTERIDIDTDNGPGRAAGLGSIRIRAINTIAYAGDNTMNVIVADANGVLKTVTQASLVPTTTNTLTATNGSLVSTVNGVATTPAVPVLISANNGLTATNGNVVLGGTLTAASTVTKDATNTLTIAGLQPGSSTDKLVVSDASGVLKTIAPAVAPKFFYAPSMVMPTSNSDLTSNTTYDSGKQVFTVDMYAVYNAQFGMTGDVAGASRTAIRSASAGNLDVVASNALGYFVTYFDNTVYDPTSITLTADGKLSYKVLAAGTITAKTYMNVIFKVL